MCYFGVIEMVGRGDSDVPFILSTIVALPLGDFPKLGKKDEKKRNI